ncbi:hypothetical protein HDU92_001073 [Lobulomyces angularis]|nr:hypothetical protein HDU92_001073 [Lobulomyces angularis]
MSLPLKGSRFSSEQTQILEHHFTNVNKNPTKNEIIDLSNNTKLSESQVAGWFTRRRSKDKASNYDPQKVQQQYQQQQQLKQQTLMFQNSNNPNHQMPLPLSRTNSDELINLNNNNQGYLMQQAGQLTGQNNPSPHFFAQQHAPNSNPLPLPPNLTPQQHQHIQMQIQQAQLQLLQQQNNKNNSTIPITGAGALTSVAGLSLTDNLQMFNQQQLNALKFNSTMPLIPNNRNSPLNFMASPHIMNSGQFQPFSNNTNTTALNSTAVQNSQVIGDAQLQNGISTVGKVNPSPSVPQMIGTGSNLNLAGFDVGFNLQNHSASTNQNPNISNNLSSQNSSLNLLNNNLNSNQSTNNLNSQQQNQLQLQHQFQLQRQQQMQMLQQQQNFDQKSLQHQSPILNQQIQQQGQQQSYDASQQQNRQDSPEEVEEKLVLSSDGGLLNVKDSSKFSRIILSSYKEQLEQMEKLSGNVEIDKKKKIMKNFEFVREGFFDIILKTLDIGILKKFVDSKGFQCFKPFLVDAKKNKSNKLILVILRTLKHLPIGLEEIKTSNGLAKIVKQLSKSDFDKEIIDISNSLVNDWSQMVLNKNAEDDNNKKRARVEDVTNVPTAKKNSLSEGIYQAISYIYHKFKIDTQENINRKRLRDDSNVGPTPKKSNTENETTNLNKTVAGTNAINSSKVIRKDSAPSPKDSKPATMAVSFDPFKEDKALTMPKIKKIDKVIPKVIETKNMDSMDQQKSPINSQLQPLPDSPTNSTNNTLLIDSPSLPSYRRGQSPTIDSNDLKKKKKVTFPSDDKLVQVKIFYIDEAPDENENENVSVSAPINPEFDLGEGLQDFKKRRLRMVSSIPYVRPPLLDLQQNSKLRNPEVISQEKLVQEEREKKEMEVNYYEESDYPLSADESLIISQNVQNTDMEKNCSNLILMKVIPFLDSTIEENAKNLDILKKQPQHVIQPQKSLNSGFTDQNANNTGSLMQQQILSKLNLSAPALNNLLNVNPNTLPGYYNQQKSQQPSINNLYVGLQNLVSGVGSGTGINQNLNPEILKAFIALSAQQQVPQLQTVQPLQQLPVSHQHSQQLQPNANLSVGSPDR